MGFKFFFVPLGTNFIYMNRIFIVLLSLSLYFPFSSKASHLAGGDISYQHLGGDSFLVTLKIYRDCSGIDVSTTSESLTFESSCGNFTLDIPFIDSTEISQLCEASSANSTCNGGTLPGMEEYVYQDIVELSPCADWNIYFQQSARNPSENIPGSDGFTYYVNTTLNSVLAPENNSIVFTAQPIPYVCLGQTVSYNWGMVEIDGDSLVYTFVCPFSGPGSSMGNDFIAPYSCTNPVDGITIDPETGEMNFTPVTQGNFIVAVQVAEYDDAGNLIGTAVRDIQFVVIPCSNNVPDDTAGTVQNLASPAQLLGPYQIELCEGDTLSFDAVYTDQDINDTLTITTNIDLVLPGAQYIVSGTNPITVHYEWIVPAGTAGTNTAFTVTVNDGACPIPGLQFFVYDISVIQATVAGPDLIICGPNTELPGQAHINVSGGTSFQWTSISGDPIIVGTNFSCDTCSTVVATPSVTTTYVVQSNLSTSCKTSDTVTVFVVPDFTFSTTLSEDSVCLYETMQFETTPNPNVSGYVYDWNASGATFSDDSIQNPLTTLVASGVQNVYLNITSPDGCLKKDTFAVHVSSNVQPDIEIYGDSTICQGDSVLLTLNNLNSNNCTFIIDMEDSFGDGWNGGELEFVVDGVVHSTHTIPAGGDAQVDTVILISGNVISINCTEGNYPWEGSYTIYDAAGVALFSANALTNGVGIWIDTFYCASTGLVYAWSPSIGLSNTNNDSVWVSATSNMTYYVTATDVIGGCMDIDSFNVYVVPTFGIQATASDDSVCLYEPVQYNVAADSAFIYTYAWTPANIMNNSTIVNPIGTHSVSGLIPVTVEVTSAQGCTKTEVLNILVSSNIFPDVEIEGDSTICEGDSVLLVANNLNSSNCTFIIEMAESFGDSWNGGALEFLVDGVIHSTHTIATSNVFNQNDTIVLTSGNVISINCIGGSYPSEGSFNILDGSGNLLFSASSLSNTLGLWTDTFYCSATGLVYTWSPSTGLSSTTEDSVWVSPTSNTTYYVTVEDPIGGCMDVDSFNIYVVPTFGITVSASDDSICLNDQVQYQVTADSTFNYTYQWQPAGIMNNANINNPVGTHNSSGLVDVTVEVSTDLGCTKYASVQVLVSDNFTPDLFVTGSDSVCQGDSTLLFASNASNQNCFVVLSMEDLLEDGWNGASLDVYLNGNYQGSYEMDFVDINPALDTIYFNSGDGISLGFNSGSWDEEITYTIYDASGNILFTDSGTDGSGPQAGANIWDTTLVCGDNGLAFSWSPSSTLSSPNEQETWASPSTNTTYTVIATDLIGGCSDTTTFTVNVIPQPLVEVTTTDTIYCLNDPTQTLAGIPTPGNWTGSFISSSGQFLPSNLGLGPELYVYHHFNGGCWGHDSITIYISAPPLSPIPSANNPYCAGYPLNDLTIVTNGGEIHWYNSSNLTTEINPPQVGASNTSLWVTETDAIGCTSDPAELVIQTAYTPNANFEFAFDSATAEAPLTIEFDNNSFPTSASYSWYINGEYITNSYDMTHLFEDGGVYAITLVGVNPTEGCIDSITKIFVLYELSVSDIPNVISPNGDGMNDKFYLKSNGLEDITMTIYNRWGKVVYGPCGPADDASICAWDGGNQPSGTYYYVVSAKDRNGKKIKREDLEGYITLIRD